MNIYTRDKKIQQELKHQDIQNLLNYFQQLQEPVILRDIRKEFSGAKRLDKDLDFLIANSIISREDRRYQLSLVPLKEYPTTEKVEMFIEKMAGRYSVEELLVWLGEVLWLDDINEIITIDYDLPTLNRLETDSFRLATINHREKLSETLPNYFSNVDQPDKFPKLAPLLGDVNTEFFSNQIELVLERMLLRKKPKRTSIFLDSLVETKVVVAEPEWQVAIPCVDRTQLADIEIEMNKKEQFFFGRQLAEQLLKGKESFTYMIKKKA